VSETADPQQAPSRDGVKRRLIRGGIALVVFVAVAIGLVALLPGLSGVGSAIGNASPAWVCAAAGIQLVRSFSYNSCSQTSRTG
jgi:hypothetical protein